MIKLEDLKIGDKIYSICSDGLGLYSESIVREELLILDVLPEPCEAVVCNGGLDVLTREAEGYLFRTGKEAEEGLYDLRLRQAKKLLNGNEFMDRLFECATSSKRLNKYGERPIYELAIELYKQEKNNY